MTEQPATDRPWYATRPIAHRGLFDDELGRPENSLAAFAAASGAGFPFEFDVQLSADGVPIVAHDRTFERLAGDPAPVSALTADAIRRLRVGEAGDRVPLLDEVLEATDGAVPIVVDVRRWAFGASRGLEKAVADRLRGYSGSYALQSFDPLALVRFRRLLPSPVLAQASGRLVSASWPARVVGRTMITNVLVRPDFVSYELDDLPATFVRLWRGAGLPVVAWTVRSVEDQRKANELADNFFFEGFLPKEEFHDGKDEPQT